MSSPKVQFFQNVFLADPSDPKSKLTIQLNYLILVIYLGHYIKISSLCSLFSFLFFLFLFLNNIFSTLSFSHFLGSWGWVKLKEIKELEFVPCAVCFD
jgi:hypothetical protein